jgi:hypothetical protein
MKAWRVTLNDCDTVVVLAETRGKATWAAIHEAEGWGAVFDRDDWKYVRTRRVPALDGETITERQMIESGLMETECAGCHAERSVRKDGAFYNDRGAAFCEGCRDAGAINDTTKPLRPMQAWFMSTEY